MFVSLRIDSIVWSRNGKGTGRASLNIIYKSKSKQGW